MRRIKPIKPKKQQLMRRTKVRVLNSQIPSTGRALTSHEAKALRKVGISCSARGGGWINPTDEQGLTGLLFRRNIHKHVIVSVRWNIIDQLFPKKKVRRVFGMVRVFRRLKPIDPKKDPNLPRFLKKGPPYSRRADYEKS